MPTPPNAPTARAASWTALTALQIAANTEFISQANYAITNAIAQGLFEVVLTTFQNCHLRYLHYYFRQLGYTVEWPDELNPNLNPYNPAELFGPDLDYYWNDDGTFPHLVDPVRMRLRWIIVP